MSILKDFSGFTIRQLKARAEWLAKAASVRVGKPSQDLLAERDMVLAELAKRES